jgi:hypothetical protein
MLTVAQPYFPSDDFRGGVILHAAVAHPLLKRLIRFERGSISLTRTDDRADALSQHFEPRVYQPIVSFGQSTELPGLSELQNAANVEVPAQV